MTVRLPEAKYFWKNSQNERKIDINNILSQRTTVTIFAVDDETENEAYVIEEYYKNLGYETEKIYPSEKWEMISWFVLAIYPKIRRNS